MSRDVNEDGARFDSGFDGGAHFSVSPEPGDVSLESALRDFGPAAIDDLIPRLRAIAAVLDAAHRAGAVHGALDPRKIFVTDRATTVVAGAADQPQPPYAAPEVLAGEVAHPAADQFSMASIAFEWMFGKPIAGPADKPVDVRAMPGIDRAAFSKAFSRALAREPRNRFASCAAFVDAVAAGVIPELPLMAIAEDDDPVEPFKPEIAEPHVPALDLDVSHDVPARDHHERAPEAMPLAPVVEREPEPAAAVPFGGSTTSSFRRPERESSPRFGAVALIAATLVGAVFGFAGGYMARPRALQSGPPEQFASHPSEPNSATPAPSAPQAPQAPQASLAGASEAPLAPETKPPKKEAEPVGRLLVRSTPSGATVTVDGVERGVTPLALRDLAIGARTLVIARRGYAAETRKVQITRDRPARTLDVRLAADAAAAAASKNRDSRRAGEVTPVKTGSLTVDSRPAGAAVQINGQDRGVTPVTIDDLAPGEYRILMTMRGYRNFATTVRVVAGEHARAAASLTAVEQE